MLNYDRLYEYRFAGIDAQKKKIVWDLVARYLYLRYLKEPERILDPAGGMCEFINAVPAREKWTIDISGSFVKKHAESNVKIVVGDNRKVKLPKSYFDGVFISNFLEHLQSQDEVGAFLSKMHDAMQTGGRIVVMGPNFKYCSAEYFDFADHTVILTELGLAEHLYAAGFNVVKIIPRFLPLSFRSGGILPVNSLTVGGYLMLPLAWRFLGKQFLLVAEKQ